MDVSPSIPNSYEALAHETSLSRFFLDLREEKCDQGLRKELMVTRKERFIAVIYDLEVDPESYYADAILPEQFDGYIWFDVTSAVKPLETRQPRTAHHLAGTLLTIFKAFLPACMNRVRPKRYLTCQRKIPPITLATQLR